MEVEFLEVQATNLPHGLQLTDVTSLDMLLDWKYLVALTPGLKQIKIIIFFDKELPVNELERK